VEQIADRLVRRVIGPGRLDPGVHDQTPVPVVVVVVVLPVTVPEAPVVRSVS
jgi:hypothetical protein